MNLKYLIYAVVSGLVILGGLDTNAAKAVSATASQKVIITVPPMRVLYVDEEYAIISILNNTAVIADNKLQAFKGGAEIAVSTEIRSQYEKLLPTVDWSRIGWVYQRTSVGLNLHEIKQVEKQTNGEIEAGLETVVCAEIAKEIVNGCENIFDRISKLNAPPLPPHKGDCLIRATVYDAEGLTEASVGYLP